MPYDTTKKKNIKKKETEWLHKHTVVFLYVKHLIYVCKTY